MRLGRGITEPRVYLKNIDMPLSVAVKYCEFARNKGFIGSGEYLIHRALEIKMGALLKHCMDFKLSNIINKGRNELVYRNKTKYIWGN